MVPEMPTRAGRCNSSPRGDLCPSGPGTISCPICLLEIPGWCCEVAVYLSSTMIANFIIIKRYVLTILRLFFCSDSLWKFRTRWKTAFLRLLQLPRELLERWAGWWHFAVWFLKTGLVPGQSIYFWCKLISDNRAELHMFFSVSVSTDTSFTQLMYQFTHGKLCASNTGQCLCIVD